VLYDKLSRGINSMKKAMFIRLMKLGRKLTKYNARFIAFGKGIQFFDCLLYLL
jgi:hypothetical protein